jgi:hypothetical protein
MLPRPLLHTLALLVTVSSTPLFGQQQVWVDPVQGDNSGPGTAAAPWRTLQHALGQATGPFTVFLQPGIYSQASGESFPLTVRSNTSIVALGDATDTQLDLSGSPPWIAMFFEEGSACTGVRITKASGSQAIESIRIIDAAGDAPVRFRGVEFLGGGATVGTIGGNATLDQCTFQGQFGPALKWHTYGRLTLRDCRIEGTNGGIVAASFYNNSVVDVTVERCVISGCQGAALSISNTADTTLLRLTVRDSLVVRSGASGLFIHDTFHSLEAVDVTIEGSTFAANGDHGLDAGTPYQLIVRNSIIAGNAMEDWSGTGTLASTLVGDGSGPSVGAGNGKLSGDPRFVDAATGDFSLRFDSSAIDAGDVASTPLDLHGWPRAVDGDLDLASAPDLGALEHRTLIGPTEVALGAATELGVTGPAGGFATVVVAPMGLAPFGSVTQFGRLFLEPTGAYRLTPVVTTGGGPAIVTLPPLNDPALIGSTVALQALTRSSRAPAGGAYSNPIVLTVE